LLVIVVYSLGLSDFQLMQTPLEHMTSLPCSLLGAEEEAVYIERVVVHLHPTFRPSTLNLTQPPFAVRWAAAAAVQRADRRALPAHAETALMGNDFLLAECRTLQAAGLGLLCDSGELGRLLCGHERRRTASGPAQSATVAAQASTSPHMCSILLHVTEVAQHVCTLLAGGCDFQAGVGPRDAGAAVDAGL